MVIGNSRIELMPRGLTIIVVWVFNGVISARPIELQNSSSTSLTVNEGGELREWPSEGFLQGMELYEML